jgi:hypothetical protein
VQLENGRMFITLSRLVLSPVYLVPAQGKPLSWTCLLPERTLDIHTSMVLFKISLIIPAYPLWLIMLPLVGILGLIGNVRLVHTFKLFLRLILVIQTCEDAFGHGFSAGDSFSWYSCCLYLSMSFTPRVFQSVSTILGCLCYYV